MAEGAGGGPVLLLPGRRARSTRPTTTTTSSTTTAVTTCSRPDASRGSSPIKTFADRDALQPRGICVNAAPGGNGAVSCTGQRALEGPALPPAGRHAHCVPRRAAVPPAGPPMPRVSPSSTCTPEGAKVCEGGERGPLRSAPGGVRGALRRGGRWPGWGGAPAALLASTFLLTLLAPARGFDLGEYIAKFVSFIYPFSFLPAGICV